MAAPDSGMRADGRAAQQIRPLHCERSTLTRADGSARWDAGATTVLAAVYGPHATVARREDATAAVVVADWRPLAGPASEDARFVESLLAGAARGALLASAHPRTAVTLAAQPLAADGSVLAAALNAAAVALVDAGVPLKFCFAAACVAITPDGELLADPTADEEAAARCVLTFAFPCRSDAPGEPVSVLDGALVAHAVGPVGDDELEAAAALARGSAAAAAAFARRGLELVLLGDAAAAT